MYGKLLPANTCIVIGKMGFAMHYVDWQEMRKMLSICCLVTCWRSCFTSREWCDFEIESGYKIDFLKMIAKQVLLESLGLNNGTAN